MARSKQRNPKRVTAAEKQIGERIALLRKIKGLSQGALGEAVGVTFQQNQKYEHGLNRASAGRLQQIATVLGVPLSSFFEEPASDGAVPVEVVKDIKVIKVTGAVELLRAYAAIRSSERRLEALKLVRELTRADRRTAELPRRRPDSGCGTEIDHKAGVTPQEMLRLGGLRREIHETAAASFRQAGSAARN
jgi:transcriptional regulator with XRE-family HTH domain